MYYVRLQVVGKGQCNSEQSYTLFNTVSSIDLGVSPGVSMCALWWQRI